MVESYVDRRFDCWVVSRLGARRGVGAVTPFEQTHVGMKACREWPLQVFSLMRSALRTAIGLRDVLLRPDVLPTLFQTLGAAESLQFANQIL